uniref:Pre-rRNA-processing protein TSR1 homolog n=1 Tax=Globodera rostochiensis TaxID=31243 RepID=A0A914I601_GLORO
MDAGEEGEYAVDDNDADEMARERFRLQRENLQWPDEVETPRDVSARQRFQRYRGLKSFRTSPWDPKEDLPRNYARIYRFVNFKRTRKLALAEAHKAFDAEVGSGEFAYPGTFVTLHIVNVPRQIFALPCLC